MNIFEQLKNRGVIYAVGIANATFKSAGAGYSASDYYIIAAKTDYNKLRGLKFNNSDSEIFQTIERDLEASEIDYFKENIDNFVNIVNNRDGKIFELNNKSFKEHYYEAN